MNAAPLTSIHRMVDLCRAKDHEPVVCRLAAGWVVMGERQVFPGYCLLLPDPVVPHLNALSGQERARFLADMACVGDALMALTGAVRINYAMFGNVEPALHAHVFPRFADESVETQRAQPWALDWDRAPAYTDSVHGDLKRRMAAYLARPFCPDQHS